jgi:cytidyltransferase-like protein
MSNINFKPYDVSLYVGRFQHIHKGHEATIEQALMVSDRILILVGSAQEQGTIRNPFDVGLRIKMIKEVYPHDNVMVHALPDYSEPGDISADWGNHVLSTVKMHLRKTPDIMIYGKEDANMNWFAHQPGEVKNITEMVIARNRYPISATQMREWMFIDDFDKWKEHANSKLHKYYDLLRRELLSAPGLQNAVHKHLTPAPKTWSDKTESVFD